MFAWLTGSRLGRYLAAVGLALAAAGMAALWLLNQGRSRERQRADLAASAAATAALAKRLAVDAELSRLGPAARRKRLLEWAKNRNRSVPVSDASRAVGK